MSSKVLGGLRRSIVLAAVTGGLLVAGAGVASADSSRPIKPQEPGPVGPVTLSGAMAGSDAALTVTTDGAALVISGRAHVQSPAGGAADGVVHRDPPRGVDLGTGPLGFAGGVTGDASSLDAVGTLRVGAERRYFVQEAPRAERP